jgi:hydroxymethylbilane synthase
MEIVIGARRSTLAKLQAFEVGRALKNCSSNIEALYNFREAAGDIDLLTKLSQFSDRGVFTEDFTKLLLNGEIDCAVHSWKDLPVENRAETEIVATLPRADSRDVLLLKRSFVLQEGDNRRRLAILTSSPRREYNLQNFLADALPVKVAVTEFHAVRGNVETRIRKLLESDSFEGLLVAKAALERLLAGNHPEGKEAKEYVERSLNDLFPMTIPLQVNPAAPAQGALAIEILRKRADLRDLFSRINDQATFDTVQKEREILKQYGGGCHQKIGVSVLSRKYGIVTSLRGITDQGKVLNRWDLSSPHTLPKAKSADSIWPQKNAEKNEKIFEREEIEPQIKINPKSGIYISRESAISSKIRIPKGQVVWVSGAKTWKAAVAKGIWVSGSSEGLGEEDLTPLGALYSSVSDWVKLTHSEGNSSSFATASPTYKLKSVAPFPEKTAVTHWFWKSGSMFLRALATNPQVKHGFHGCGPGSTFALLKEHLPESAKVKVFLSISDFYKEVLQ